MQLLGPAYRRALRARPDDFPELREIMKDKNRRRRSERVEALGLVVEAVTVRTDLLSLVVRWKGAGLPVATIAKWTGLSTRRIRRVFADLRFGATLRGPGKYGPNRIPQPVEKYDPTKCRGKGCTACKHGLPHECRRKRCQSCATNQAHFRGKAAIRQLTILPFEKVGLDGMLREWQRRAWAEQRPTRPPPAPPSPRVAELNRQSIERELRLALAARPPP